MPRRPLPFFGKSAADVDEIERADDASVLIDGYIDSQGFVVKRPGLSTLVDLGAGTNQRVEGIFWWPHKSYAIAVAGGNIYKVTYSSGTATVVDLTGDALSANVPITFTTDGTYAFLAADGRVVYTDGSANTAYLADADAPTTVSHVGYIDKYILANELSSSKFWWSDVGSSLAWTATSFASAEGNADYLTALKVLNREILLFGPNSFEKWENDGATPFVRVPGGYREIGCIAPHSVTIDNEDIYWLDHNKHIRKYSGGQIQTISTSYDKQIAEYSSIADCRGFKVEIAGLPFLIFNFLAENKTLVYNIRANDWHEWGAWDDNFGEYNRWMGNVFCYAPDWGLNLVGSKTSPILYTMSPDSYDDAGDEIRLKRVTGFVDHGSSKRKRNREIAFRLKRGAVDLSSTPKIMIRWRDEGSDRWSNIHEMTLNSIGNREFVARKTAMGIYRARQYEITATDAAPIIFGRAEEDFDWMSS